jgi:hypothetical protein
MAAKEDDDEARADTVFATALKAATDLTRRGASAQLTQPLRCALAIPQAASDNKPAIEILKQQTSLSLHPNKECASQRGSKRHKRRQTWRSLSARERCSLVHERAVSIRIFPLLSPVLFALFARV